MQIDLSRFRETFFDEAAEHVAALESGLLELQQSGGDRELLNAIFRAAHSIKGGAGSFGLDEIARFTHVMEGVLDRLRGGTLAPDPALVTLLLSAVDTLNELLRASRQGRAAEVPIDEALAALGRVLSGESGVAPVAAAPVAAEENAAAAAAAAASGPAEYRLRFAPHPGFFFGGQDPLLLLRELGAAGEVRAVEADLSGLPALETLDPEHCHLAWALRIATAGGEQGLRDVFMFVEDACVLEIAPARVESERRAAGPGSVGTAPAGVPERRGGADRRVAVAAAETTSIRVATEKVDALVDLLGELVIAQSMVHQIVTHFSADRLHELQGALTLLDRNTRELQERVMGVRMLPVSTVFSRFPRLVHDLSRSFGKDVRLEVSGGEIELDKSVIERLSDPLTHLIRNAVDHGIEPPEARAGRGKPGRGTVTLRALHEGGNVVIEVGDDGNGLDRERIRAKAVAQGLLRAEDAPPDEALHALIFEPGFSTAKVVTDVSGRGVGMDVVKRNVEALNGAVSVHSAPGTGTRFRIRLPLTLAILDGLVVRLGGQVYVMPLVAIVESLRPRPDDVRPVLGRGEVLRMRGATLPFVRLTRVLGAAGVEDPARGIVIVLEGGAGRFGVLVDDVVGQAQVVVKSLEAHYRKVEGIMGATIMGDGRVALILDVQGLSALAARTERPATSAHGTAEAQAAARAA